jgi:hypothetical protein
MDKQDKIEIVNEALDVLYRELNDYSVHSDFPVQDVPHIVESILKLEKLSSVLRNEDIDLIKYLKGELK